MPELYVEARGRSCGHPPLAHKMTLLDGGDLLRPVPELGRRVQPGTAVSVVVDGVRSQPVGAES